MKATSRTIAVFTNSDDKGVATTEDHTHSSGWFTSTTGVWNRICADIQPNRFHSAYNLPRPARIDGGANYLYADGHVEYIPAAQVKAWADADRNFALPPD